MSARSERPVLLRVGDRAGIAAVLAGGGVGVGAEVVVVVGGADGLDDGATPALVEVLRHAVVAVAVRRGATVVDGGTDAGVMRLVGRARAASGDDFPLVGVAAEGTVVVPGVPSRRPDAVEVEPHHTHLLLVPGAEWGDEVSWISDVACVVAGGRGSVTVLLNGGEISFADAAASLAAGRPLVVLAGTGRTADAIADARATGEGDPRAVRIAASPLTRVEHVGDLAAIASALEAAMT